MGLIKDLIGSSQKKYYRFWLQYYYGAEYFENVNLQRTPSEFVFNFFLSCCTMMHRNRKSLKQNKTTPKNEGTRTGFIPNGSKVTNINLFIILSQYFASSFRTRITPIMISILSKLILEWRCQNYGLNTFKAHLRTGAPKL